MKHKTIFSRNFKDEGFEPYIKEKKYEDGHYLTVRFSPISGEMYYAADSCKDGKMQLGICDGSFRLFVRKESYNFIECFFNEYDGSDCIVRNDDDKVIA